MSNIKRHSQESSNQFFKESVLCGLVIQNHLDKKCHAQNSRFRGIPHNK